MTPIRIAIVDDEALFRKGMSLLLEDVEDVEDIEVVMDASNGQEFLDQLKDNPSLPDVVLMDMKMPILNGIETAKVMSVDFPEVKIITLSTYFSKAFVTNMLELGVASYLAKNSKIDLVELTIREVAEKGFYYSDEIQGIIRESMLDKKRQSKATFSIQLTAREKEILQLICEQHTNAEIAKKLYISSRTVDGHRNNLLQKMNCKNTAGLVALAMQQQLVKVSPSQFWA